jgi:hypothetical protein
MNEKGDNPMNENNLLRTTNEQDTLQSIFISEICKKISDAITDAENSSREKYATKQNLIKSANDMNTNEKLEAMDRNNERRNQERWQNALYFAVIFSSVVGVSIGSRVCETFSVN